tara:strand:+ start:608 stop:1057 length:450 start_codon:yes stop_codon:yes gene_type:complete
MKKKKYTKYKQGVYKPTKKYKGYNNPVYRSSWELRFFRWCDNNPNVLQWTSESTIIPYISPIDNKAHRYFVDNTIVIKESDKLVKYVIEIKPKKQTVKPKTHGNKKQSTILYENIMYVTNLAKWEAADRWCKKHGYKFQILTEDHLFGK